MHPERRPNPERSPEALEARLRALPPPPVPAGLEARLLAAIPVATPVPRRRRAVWVGAAGALAAACLLAVLAWPGRDGENPFPSPPTSAAPRQVTPRPPDDSAGLAARLEARRVLDGAELSPFTWPLQETSPLRASTSIPPDLLD
jgi:hypothetical protein